MSKGTLARERENTAVPPGPGRLDSWVDASAKRTILSVLTDITILAGFWLLFFWPILVTRTHLIPYDLIDQHYMYQAFIHRSLQGGELPWWAPDILGGYPMVADPLSAIFYPPNLLMHALAQGPHLPYLHMEWQATLHFLWAAVGTYLLARSLTGSRSGALLAALTYAFSSFFAMHTPHLSPISGLSWLPWILLTYWRAIRTRSLPWSGLAALTFGMMMLAGHALTIVQIGYLMIAVTAVAVWHRWSQDRRRDAIVAGGLGFSVLVLGAALAMVQLLPSWELSSQTERANFSYADATASSYMPHWAFTLVLPNFFAPDGPAQYWASGDPAETNLYAGLLPLFLAALGVAFAKGQDRRVIAWLLATLLVSLVLAFGSQTWVYRVAFDVLPGVDRVRRPTNYGALVQFALALLAAYGMKSLHGDDGAENLRVYHTLGNWLRRALLAVLSILALAAIALASTIGQPTQQVLVTIINGIVFAGVMLLAAFVVLRSRLHWQLSTRVVLTLLVVIAAIDLGSALSGEVYEHHRQSPDSYIGADWAGTPSDPLVPMLLTAQRDARPEQFRIYPEQAGSIWENGPLVWGLESASGYSVLWPTQYRQLLEAVATDPTGNLLDLLNVRYLLLGDAVENVYPGANPQTLQLIHDGPPKVYENPDPYPRVWVAHRAVSQPEGSTLAYLRANAGSLRDVVVVNEALPAGVEATPSGEGSATIVDYQNTRVTIQASLSAPGFVVLADTHYPGWEARVDGEPTHVYRADHAFRAVWVPAGEHEVEFNFVPRSLRLGGLISAGAAIVILTLILIAPLSRRRRAVSTRRSPPG